jgi:DNA-binding NtrC family response regulator
LTTCIPLREDFNFLQKPFRIEKLVSLVRSALN